MIKKVDIKGSGEFKVKKDLTHRPRVYLKLYTDSEFKEIQFNSLDINDKDYQFGYDNYGKEIQIKILEKI